MPIALIGIFLWTLTLALGVFVAYMFFLNLNRLLAAIKRRVPLVPSSRALRDAVIKEINTHYPHMKTVCDIGGGYGGLGRAIGHGCGMHVTSIEVLPFPALVSKTADILTRVGSKTIWADAFKYLSASYEKFDIVVAYLGPEFNARLPEILGGARVLITLSMPVPRLSAIREVEIPNGGITRFGRVLYPNRLFVYEFSD